MSAESTYDDDVKIWKQAYTELLEVCERYGEFRNKYHYSFSDIRDMGVHARDHLMLIDWYEKYGLKLEHSHRPYYNNFFGIDDYRAFNRFGDAQKEKEERSGRFISWPDDDRQPNNEWLFQISFPSGAFIFGQDYAGQQQLFQDFFKELKSYQPDYSDTHNKSLYWKLENAKPIFNNFSEILAKYRKRNTSELKQREADKLREQLAKIEDDLSKDAS